MGWNPHATSGILTTPESNPKKLNMLLNYGNLSTSKIQTYVETYLNAHIRQTQNNN